MAKIVCRADGSHLGGLLEASELAKGIGGQLPELKEPVYFVARELRSRWPELSSPDAMLDLAVVPAGRWFHGEGIWVVGTYLRLRQRGLNVRITDHLVPDAINVCYADQVIQDRDSHRAFVVIAQGDRCYGKWGEYVIAQSPVTAAQEATCLIDMWPQPGLIERDSARGARVERMAYTGNEANLAEVFRKPEFARDLRTLGVEFVVRDQCMQWHDFSDVDLHLAVRNLPWRWVRTKPSTKLVHSWLTGCPALLGPEPSYQHWGVDQGDYFEVRTPQDVLRIVRRLKDDAGLYEKVRKAGFVKAGHHSEEAVCRQWGAVLDGPIAEHFAAWRRVGAGELAARVRRRSIQRLAVPLSRKLFYLRARNARGVFKRLGEVMTQAIGALRGPGGGSR